MTTADTVYAQLARNYSPDAIGWVRDATWSGPTPVPLDRVDFDDADSWTAAHQPDRVDHFAHDAHQRPVVAVQTPGDDRIKIVDGHHRALADRNGGRPVTAYIGRTSSDAWRETHTAQHHQGADPANKAARPVAAGLAVHAADTGRILMLQRAQDDTDPAAGMWEFPGGRLEAGETPLRAARSVE